MVHRKSKEQEASEVMILEGTWRSNVNFLSVPIELVEQFKGRVSKNDWVVWADWYNKCPSIWNLAFVSKEGVVEAFMYGSWEPLERELRVIRITVNKGLYSYSGVIMQEAIDVLRILAKKMEVRFVYFETTAWKVFLRKLKGEVNLSKAKILEVL